MKKKIDLENFVKQNQNLFNLEEPNEGHFERFKAKLEEQPVRKNLFIGRAMRYAAVIVLLISGVLIYTQTGLFNGNSGALAESSEIEINEEFSEISNFYDSQIDIKLEEIDQIQCKQGTDQRSAIGNDLEELNASYAELKNEYTNDPENQMIQNALINNYQMRLSILDMVVDKLKNYC
jgi:hypothetical protein